MYQLLSLVAAATTVLWLLRSRLARPPKLDLPYLDLEGDKSRVRYASESVGLMAKGYAKYVKNGRPFSIRNITDDQNPIVLLPLKYLDEVKNAPQDKLSFAHFVDKNSIISDVRGPRLNDSSARMVRVDLNRALPGLVEPMRQECLAVFKKAMPPCPDWTMVIPYPLLLQLFTRTSARVLAGSELSQNDEWLGTTQQYVASFLQAVKGVRSRYNPSFRWIAKYIDNDVKKAEKHRQHAADILRPILHERLQAKAAGIPQDSEDGLQWLIDAYQSNGKTPKAEEVVLDLLGMSVSSIHSSSATLLSTLYDLIDHPDAMKEIREEIHQVAEGREVWDRQALGSLFLLDSFMKESQRIHSVPEVSVQRVTVVPWTFQDGFHIPAGTQIGFPNRQLNLDADVFPEPQHFDAKRFSRKRQGEDINKFHFASVANDSLGFGAGSQACPGRFLAQEAIKLIFVHLLTNYDLKYMEEGQTRPADMPDNLLMLPSFATPLMFKEVAT